MNMKTSYCAALAVLLTACGSDGGGTEPDATSPSLDARVNDAHPGDVLAVTIGPITIPGGAEDTVCVVLDLGNEMARTVRAIRTELSNGTHHVIINRSGGAPVQPTPQQCGAFSSAGSDDQLLFIAQQPHAELRYPDGTGLRIGAHESIHLEMHYFNYLPGETADISATVYFELAPDDGSQLAPVDLLFTGDFSLTIPAHSKVTKTSFHSVDPADHIFALTTHMHQLGVHGTIHRATSETDPSPVLLYETNSWSEAPLQTYEPFQLAAGEGLLLTCEYVNPTDQDVHFGLGFEDEMCFLWAHTFRAR